MYVEVGRGGQFQPIQLFQRHDEDEIPKLLMLLSKINIATKNLGLARPLSNQLHHVQWTMN
jgi:hypothetical protein